MAICKYCGKLIENEIVMNPDEHGDGYHHFCLIDKEFREEQRRIYNHGMNDALDKIRAEIDQLPSYVAKFAGGDFAIHIDKEKVFEIIDKYKTERR